MVKAVNNLHRSWTFTWNNYTVENINTLNTYFKNYCKKYIFQEEIGESGTPHLQGVFNLKQASSFEKVKLKLGESHIEVCRSFKKSWNYCCKEESRNGEIWSHPKLYKENKILSKMEIAEDMLASALEELRLERKKLRYSLPACGMK